MKRRSEKLSRHEVRIDRAVYSAREDNGYRACACRDCFEIAIGSAGALCWECREAGCEAGAERECRVERFPEEASCPACSGEGEVLGQLGSRLHFRCRACGIGFSLVL